MKKFVENQVKKIITSYQIENERITSEYNRENELLDSYRGREILELIQNAEDELTDDMPKEIYISFDGKKLSISNYGDPFNEDGINSLMYSNLSAKKKRKKKVIGNKGTGFRSILGWAEEIKIDSEQLHVRYSHAHAQKILRDEVFQGKELPKGLKAATLVFPEWVEDNYESKYTTTISLRIKTDEKVADDIREQLKGLSENLLLFLNHTERITIKLEDSESCFEKRVLEDGRVHLSQTVDGADVYSKEWLINRCEGTIDEECYSIVMAYDSEGNMPKNPFIHTYFPTDVRFPFSVLLHADFKLNADRNHLIKKDASNRQILEDVASLLIDTAIKIYKKVSYDRIKFLLPKGEYTQELQEYKFDKILKDAMKKAEIFPTVNGKYVAYNNNLKFYETRLAKYLTGNDFSDLLMYSDNGRVDKLLFEFTYKQYDYFEMASKVNKWVEKRSVNDDNIRKVAYTAIGFHEEFEDELSNEKYKAKCPAFFYNLDRKLVPSGTPIFLIDENYEITKPPKFANVEFLDPYMRNYFYKKLHEEDERLDEGAIIKKLCEYNVKEYNASELINHIDSVIIEKIEAGRKKEAKARWETLIKWLWDNRKLLAEEKAEVSMQFLNKKGELVESSGLYYGLEYGNQLIEDLFGKFFPEKIACDLKKFIEDADDGELISFLKNFGVDETPRLFKIGWTYTTPQNSQHYNPYLKRVFEGLRFPITLDNTDVFDDLDDFCNRVKKVEIWRTEISQLKAILNKSDTVAILKWIRTDNKLQNHLFNGYESEAMSVKVMYDKVLTYRPLKILKRPYSYIHYLFETEPWIQVKNKRYTLGDCLLGFNKYGIDFDGLLVEPDIAEYIKNSEGQKSKLKREYRGILERLHVKDNFADLSIDKIYKVLNQIPEIAGSAEIAKNFYNDLIDKNKDYSDEELNSEEYNKYITSGKILTNNGFKPISESYYLDGRDVCEKVASKYNLICIPKKRNRKRIKKLLGIDQLKLESEMIGNPVVHPCNSAFACNFSSYKIMAFVYRMNVLSDSNVNDEAKKFRNINIVICQSVRAKYKTSKDDTPQEVELEDYEYILHGECSYYLKVPETLTYNDIEHNVQLASSIANIFSSYLDVSEIVRPFRELYFAGSYFNRESIIQQEFEDDEIINKAREILNMDEDIQEEFSHILVKMSGRPQSDFDDFIEEIDFNAFNEDYNVKAIIGALKLAGINAEDYNAESTISTINLVPYYEREIHNKLPAYLERYKRTWFRKLEHAPLQDKLNLVDNFLLYNTAVIRIENDIWYDVDREIIKQLEINDKVDDVDLTKLYHTNCNTWKRRLDDPSEVEDFLKVNENMSLVYYALYDELNKRYNEYCQELKEEEKYIQNVIVHDTEQSIEVYYASTKPSNKAGKKLNLRHTTGFTYKMQGSNLEEVGLAGERIVYNHLSGDKSKKLVRWVSENAKKDGINPEGSAGLGYDIEYIDESGNRKYVEVKTSKSRKESGIRFYMSDNEYEFGREHSDSYLIYYVSNVKDPSPQILIFENVFENNDFNKKCFEVSASKYTVTAQIDS